MSGKSKIFGCHWLIFFANFWICFVIVAAAPFLFFRGARHLQYLQNNFSPGETPKKKQLGSLLEVFPTLRPPPYFFHIPFIPSKKLPLAIVGMGGKCVGFICFLQFLPISGLILVISCPLSFLRGTRHLQYP